MNDYVSRIELTPVDRAVSRAPSSVQAVQPVAASRSTQLPLQETAKATPPDEGIVVDEDMASAAEYVEVHARISEILADLQSTAGSVDDAAGAIQAMIPRPIVLVPLPPASKEAVEHAAVLAKRIVERASYAHGAQAHVARGTVDQVTASVG
ncbi:hypothetical protein [Sphingobium sp. HWE2-09]|uniref:hypothetical protein n=1 Tax=Sphingobium sp. HWE2-09 TaxID=3108390 RepID=UPI002DCDF193|nr:hypothetical protein [Sphingobium sp. HWE2-09]